MWIIHEIVTSSIVKILSYLFSVPMFQKQKQLKMNLLPLYCFREESKSYYALLRQSKSKH